MHRLNKLFLALALVMSVSALTAGTINFTGLVTGGVGDGNPLPSASSDGTTVSFFTSPSGVTVTSSAYGAVQGAPKTAFANNEEGDDTVDGSANGEFLTDEPTGNSISRDYLFGISGMAIMNFGLDLYDFGDSLFSGPGGTATLQAFSDAAWAVAVGAPATYIVPAGPFNDGNIQTLFVNPGSPIGSVRLSFSTGVGTPGQDTGTGVDNLFWDTTTAIPEPGTVVLFGSGLLALAAFARRRRTTQAS
jgi:PEP-CTERM motif